MQFEIVGAIREVEIIAAGRAVRVRGQLRKRYGHGVWRKLKGVATVRLRDGTLRTAELHWYEATGVGRKEFKIKLYLT